jgi:hypothetical protein
VAVSRKRKQEVGKVKKLKTCGQRDKKSGEGDAKNNDFF